MSKFSIKSVSSKVKVPKRKTILIVASSLVVIAAIIVSVAALQVSRQNKAEQDRKAAAATTAQITNLQNQVKAEQAKNTAVTSDKAVLCSYIGTLEKAPATRGRLTKPTAAHCF